MFVSVHRSNAVRMVVEGDGAYTTVDGHKLPMSRGDLILTPTGLWHEHGHDGDQPVVWLDVLDLPIVYFMEASYVLPGERQAVKASRGDRAWSRAGVVPSPVFARSDKRNPVLRYPWAEARAALLGLAADQPELDAVQVTYVNPETGADAQNILGFHALMLRPGQSLALPARSPACVLHAIEGSAEVQAAVAEGRADREDNLLKHAPHHHQLLIAEQWQRPYSKAEAFFPMEGLNEDKYWPPVSRIDNVYGDKHVVCSCPPMEAYRD